MGKAIAAIGLVGWLLSGCGSSEANHGLTNCACQPGPQGPQGDKGATGRDGVAGPQGPQGDPGQTGAIGPAGSPGLDGRPGSNLVVTTKDGVALGILAGVATGQLTVLTRGAGSGIADNYFFRAEPSTAYYAGTGCTGAVYAMDDDPDLAKLYLWIQGDATHALYTRTAHAAVTTASAMTAGACVNVASNLNAPVALTDSGARLDVAASKPWGVAVTP